MARVIQQRKSGPPYLLILFVFLFLVVTVLAVLLYLDNDKTKADAAKVRETNRALAGNEMEGQSVQAMLGQFHGTEGGGVTVVGQLEQKIDRLTQWLTGNAKSTTAEAEAEKAFARIGSRPGLAQAVVGAYDKIDELTAQLKAKDADIASQKKATEDKQKELAALEAARAKEQGESTKKISDLDARLTTVQRDFEKKIAELTEDRAKQIADRDKTIAQQDGRIMALEAKLKKTEDDLAIALAAGRGPKPDPGSPEAMLKPNGRILRTGGEDTVYVDFRARPGLSFSVYPSTGIPTDANNYKAKLRVLSVGDTYSTCQVTFLQDQKDPIVPGDVVFNVVFDRTRTFKFVVVGLFDIYRARQPDLRQGQEEVKALIQRFGGSVQDEVTTDTDYVVVGEEPAGPKAPEDGGAAPPALPEVEKARQQYQDARKKASEFRIPILNTNRFLQLTGFDPSTSTGNR